MQETPDTMTKLVWGNAALMSPKTATELGLEDGDVVKLTRGSLGGEFAVMRQPGHADGAISLTLGYGRKKVGRVGQGVGYDAYALRTSDAYRAASGFTLAKTGGRVNLVTTQNHHSLEGRPLLREASLEEYRKHPKVIEEMLHHPPLESIYGDWDYSKGYQWGMAIDLASCIGCNACTLACQSENNIPVVGAEQVMRGREMAWIRMDRYYNGDENDPQVVYQGVPCMQCENAPCENVCPVAATVHSPEGLNDMAYNRCVGTRYCANNCPYKVRRFNFLNFHKNMTEVEKMASNPDVSVRMRGIMEKCTYCVQRIQEVKIKAKADGRRAIKDGEIQTACQQTCPAEAIVFGNIADPNSRVSKVKKLERNYAMLAELNVKPRTTYLGKLRNPNPELA
jgi:molybdopterin-containing oxidoreductase family iron-sulfur binding subunit